MKKILVLIAIIIICLINSKNESEVISNNSIRLRVISASNKIEDIIVKNELSIEIKNYINELLANSKSYVESTKILSNNYENLKNIIDNYLNKKNIQIEYNISIGKNLFPKKKYKGVVYKKGYYDSVVVTLNEGKGINWWCIVYPPLCLIDDKDEVEYTSYIKEILS